MLLIIENILSVVSTSSVTVLEDISLALQFLLGNGGKYTVDYRLVLLLDSPNNCNCVDMSIVMTLCT